MRSPRIVAHMAPEPRGGHRNPRRLRCPEVPPSRLESAGRALLEWQRLTAERYRRDRPRGRFSGPDAPWRATRAIGTDVVTGGSARNGPLGTPRGPVRQRWL